MVLNMEGLHASWASLFVICRLSSVSLGAYAHALLEGFAASQLLALLIAFLDTDNFRAYHCI